MAVGRRVPELFDLRDDLFVRLVRAEVDNLQVVDFHADRLGKPAVPGGTGVVQHHHVIELAFVDQRLHVRHLIAHKRGLGAGFRRGRARRGDGRRDRVARATDVEDGENEQGNDLGLHEESLNVEFCSTLVSELRRFF